MNIASHKFNHLTRDERVKIETFFYLKYKITKIAQELGRNKSTISREIKRCKYVRGYIASIAQTRANKAKTNSHQHKKITYYPFLNYAHRMLKEKWSPEIISATWNIQNPNHKVSHTSIYNFIKRYRPEWNKYLIYKGKYKNKRKYSNKAGVYLIPNRIDISLRPEVINQRFRTGDFEADTVFSCKGSKSALAVFVDRKTRLYKIVKMKNKTAEEMFLAAKEGLKNMNVKSITYDNGSENVKHEEVNRIFNSESYFCKAYCSADKGSIENRNKILRQFFPKKTNFDLISKEQLDIVEEKINNRPMKLLGWLSPTQFEQKLNSLQFQL